MKASAEFFIRGDPLESLFNDAAGPDSALLIRQFHGLITAYDGHSTALRPYAKVLLDRAAELIARSDSMLSPLIHGLDSGGTGCEPMALVVRPRGEALIMPVSAAEESVRQRNPQPVLRRYV